MSAEENLELSTEVAGVLLAAIKEAAPSADARSTEGLRQLAEAYSLVHAAMPRKSGRSSTS